jgi:Fe-S cluster assembly ATP-binding protein
MGVLELKNITLELDGTRILDDLSIDFWKGHIHALVGPNGAGKSTTANVVMGLAGYREFEGDVLLDGASIKELPVNERAERGLTLAWQEPARFEGLSVREFIAAAAKDKGEDALLKSLAMVGLEPNEYVDRTVDKTLSGGERKRIEMASILAMNPRVVIMDEPDSGIDVAALEHIFENLSTLKRRNTTVILITHSPTVLRQAEHAFLMCCGRVVDKGDVEKIARYFEEKCIPCDHKNRPALGGPGAENG